MNIIKKFPTLEQIAPVYAVIVMIIYAWTLVHFFWRLPSWFLFSNLSDLASIFAYMIVVNLMESLLVLVAPLLLNMVLPRAWFYDRFTTRSVSLVLVGLGYLIYLDDHLQAELPFPIAMVRWIPAVMVVILVLVYLLDRFNIIRRLLDGIANRALIFLYISIPISVISLLVILIRNIA